MFLISQPPSAASTSCKWPMAPPAVRATRTRPSSMYASSCARESSASSNSGRSDARSPVCSSMSIMSTMTQLRVARPHRAPRRGRRVLPGRDRAARDRRLSRSRRLRRRVPRRAGHRRASRVHRRRRRDAAPLPHPETLLVLYLGSADAVRDVAARIGAEPVAPANPYWAEHGADVHRSGRLPRRAHPGRRPRLEVDAHHGTPDRRTGHLGEASAGEHPLRCRRAAPPAARSSWSWDRPRSRARRARGRTPPRRARAPGRCPACGQPARAKTQVTAQTLSSVLSSARSAHGTRLLRTGPSKAVRGSTAHHPGRLAVEVGDEAAGRARSRDGRTRSAGAAGPRGPRRGTRRSSPAARACSAGTGTWTPGAARAEDLAPGPRSSPRWRDGSRSARSPPLALARLVRAAGLVEGVEGPRCRRRRARSRRSGRSPRCARGGSTSAGRSRLCSMHQRRSTWAGVRPSRSAMRPTTSVVEVAAGAERAVGLDRHAAHLTDVEQRAAVLERAELDLVDGRRRVGHLEHGVDLGDAEVGDADRAGVPRFAGALHPVPGPRRPALRPVDDVEVDGVDAEPLEAALHLGDGILAARVELRRDEDVLARDAAVADRPPDAAFVLVGLRRVDVAVAQPRAPSAPRSRTPARPAPARPRAPAAGSRCRPRGSVSVRPP